MKNDDYYNEPHGCERKTMILIILIAAFISSFIFSSCAYQKYHAQNFKPDRKDNKVRACYVYDKADTMRDYYKKR